MIIPWKTRTEKQVWFTLIPFMDSGEQGTSRVSSILIDFSRPKNYKYWLSNSKTINFKMIIPLVYYKLIILNYYTK